MNMQTATNTADTIHISLPDGREYNVPANFLDGKSWLDFDPDEDDLFGENPERNHGLATAFAAISMVRWLEAGKPTQTPPLGVSMEPPKTASKAIRTVLNEGGHRCTLEHFAEVIAPAAYAAMQEAEIEGHAWAVNHKWWDHVRDLYGEGVKCAYPIPETWVPSVASLSLAYHELRKQHDAGTIASAVAGALCRMTEAART